MPEYRKKLIEVALPLETINKESAREKSIRHGHLSTLHLWWARRPLAACRAVLFAQMVDDPSSLPDEFPTEEAQETERQRLFCIIEDLVKWVNTTNEAVLHAARVEIARSAARNFSVSLPNKMTHAEVVEALKQYAPPVLDPFAGGGSIPLEAQRLGLKAHASDLNPVAVLINKALIEIPPKFAERPPLNPDSRKKYLTHDWKGAQGLAEDIRYYGKWMQDEAWKRIGHLYPKVQLQKEQGGGEATVIAWLWTRTVKCPNPACSTQMPLARSFTLSAKKGKEVYVKPIVDRSVSPPSLRFEIVRTNSFRSDATAKRSGATCLACGTPVGSAYIRSEGVAGRLGSQMFAIVGEAKGERAYLPPSQMHELIASKVTPAWEPSLSLSNNARHMAPPLYGMRTVADLFTRRQLVALTTFSDLVGEARMCVFRDVKQADPQATDAHAYADAVATYLAFAVDRGTDYWSSFALWAGDFIAHTFGRPALGIVWDYAEANPFSSSTGNWEGAINWIARVVQELPCGVPGIAIQHDAMTLQTDAGLVSTDPPYYDNVPYAVM